MFLQLAIRNPSYHIFARVEVRTSYFDISNTGMPQAPHQVSQQQM